MDLKSVKTLIAKREADDLAKRRKRLQERLQEADKVLADIEKRGVEVVYAADSEIWNRCCYRCR